MNTTLTSPWPQPAVDRVDGLGRSTCRVSRRSGDARSRRDAGPLPLSRAVTLVLVGAVVSLATGCTTALTSAYLRALPWETAEHAAEPDDPGDPSAEPAAAAATETAPGADDGGDERRAAAIDEAVSRLSRLGRLDEAAAASLVATLRVTQQEDWPVVIAEFAAALPPPPTTDDTEGGADTADDAISTTSAPPPHVVAKAELTPTAVPAEEGPAAGSLPTAAAPTPPATAVETSTPPDATAAAAAPDDAAPDAAAPAEIADEVGPSPGPAPALRIANACFASRVQAWGVVDRFPSDRFRAGREVIVYFELDGLSAQATAAGHTTCIDTVLRLVDDHGATVHEWDFEPLAETCGGRRRDYFARYVVRLPADAPAGRCRLEVVVSDTLAGADADATLPLEIVAANDPDAG